MPLHKITTWISHGTTFVMNPVFPTRRFQIRPLDSGRWQLHTFCMIESRLIQGTVQTTIHETRRAAISVAREWKEN